MKLFDSKPNPRQIRPLEARGDVVDAGAAILVRRTWLILLYFFIPLLIWSFLANIKEVSHVQGQVMPGGTVHVVQHLEGGIVLEILVNENQTVDKDQVLFRLDRNQSLPERRQAELRLAAMQAKAIRLRAFKSGDSPDFSESYPGFSSLGDAERINYNNMLKALDGTKAVLDSQVAQRRLDVKQVEDALENAEKQETVTGAMLKIRKELVDAKAISRVIYLETLRAHMTAKGEVKRLRKQIDNLRGALNETLQRRDKLVADARNEASVELGTVMNEMAQMRESISGLKDQLTRLDVRSPVRGIVQELQVRTQGEVVKSGQVMALVVPLDDQLRIEVRIPPHEVGRVVKGQDVVAKLSSYEFSRFGTIPGQLVDFSPGAVKKEGEQPYFKGIVVLARDYVGGKPGVHPVLPGMQAQVDIPLGDRSVLAIIMQPVSKALQAAFRER